MSAFDKSNLSGLGEIRRSVASTVTPDELAKWVQPSYVRLATDVILIWVQIGLGATFYIVWPSSVTFLISWFVIGGAQHGCGLVAHEGAHQLVFPNNLKLNDAVCRWAFAAPIGLPFNLYRQRHLAHHRLVSTPADTKQLYQRLFRGSRMWIEVVRSLSGFDYVQQVCNVLSSTTDKKQIPGMGSVAVFKDFSSILIANLGLFALFAAIDWRLYFLLWILPLVTTSVLWSKFRSVVEHYPIFAENFTCDGAKYFHGTRVPVLRSVGASSIEKLFFSKLNFHFHAEHHLWPNISYQYLPKVNKRLTDNLGWKVEGLNQGSGYLHTLHKIYLQK